jgi:hypothetical protein
MDQTLSPFHECQMVAEAAFKQHPDAMVTGNIGGRDQRDIFSRAHVAQLIRLCQYEEPSGYRDSISESSLRKSSTKTS